MSRELVFLPLVLYTGTSETNSTCPLCDTELTTPTPSAADLAISLEALNRQLDAVGAERPHLLERLNVFGKKRGEIEKAIVSTQQELERTYAEDEKARIQRDYVVERARVVGRISAFLVRQANWQKVGGESPLERRTNQPRFSASRASGTVRGQAKRR